MRVITDVGDDGQRRDRTGSGRRPPIGWPRRIMWFVAIWAASVALLGVVSYGLRLWIGPA